MSEVWRPDGKAGPADASRDAGRHPGQESISDDLQFSNRILNTGTSRADKLPGKLSYHIILHFATEKSKKNGEKSNYFAIAEGMPE